MPNLDITEQEAKRIIAFLKWMSSIDTNGFPHNFKTINAGGMSMNTSGLNGVMQNAAALCEKSRACLNNFKAWVQLDSSQLSDGQAAGR